MEEVLAQAMVQEQMGQVTEMQVEEENQNWQIC